MFVMSDANGIPNFYFSSAVYNFDEYSLIIYSGLVSARLKMSAYSELSETLFCWIQSSLESEVFHLDPVLIKYWGMDPVCQDVDLDIDYRTCVNNCFGVGACLNLFSEKIQ